MEQPRSERIQFQIRESYWIDGLARAMQEALAQLCGQNVNMIQGTGFHYYATHDIEGVPLDAPPHPELSHHVEHLDFMLHETQKELDNSRTYANQTHLALMNQTTTIQILDKDRKTLRRQCAKRDSGIELLRTRITSLEV